MTLMPHGITQSTAPEQQPKSTSHNQQLQSLGMRTHSRNWTRRHLNKFPRREVSQRSSITDPGEELGEPSLVIGPMVKKLIGMYESWLSLVKTRSNLVSPRNGDVNTLPLSWNSGVNNYKYYHHQANSTKQNATGRQPPNAVGPIASCQIQPARIQGDCDHLH